ncbi:alpha/beta fold hydrolase [Cerasicoccus frondis]|uniref:alpha/beta fold hydrolase n=1 Tax=Cerasicoccus frondis TaxID=490090 RepID=UPI002852B1B8|nr:alpha/beta hydrolase [Cerasicoccus frondis]
MDAVARSYKTSDGVRLHYWDAGEGSPLVFLPGWSQTAAMFRGQFELAENYRCLALDWRGHGESDKPATGYRHARLAKDLLEWLTALELDEVTIVAHSMGCKVVWNYWELFGASPVKRLIVVDQSPRLVSAPSWSDTEIAQYGATTTPEELEVFLEQLSGVDGEAVTRRFVPTMFTPAIASETLEWVIAENLKMPRKYAAFLLRETMYSDSRDILPRIGWPTLVVSGEGSHVPTSALRWTQQQIPHSRFASIAANEGGSHFCFLENSAAFNQILQGFLAETR